ncbi:DUF1516 family protein [Fructilactobacillus carniphilus]|uniref:DUF1516 family protein n=1 Tax=Fructilactobacillus carniphilus TaxID=2940297 RepID=A0ABY5BXI1_9LACO|nr:DUF1516 family protein [Fructilactobacillus carniphilus]USS91207.1 DUF1516 family protein [Fructilactobacillus carniphilus]
MLVPVILCAWLLLLASTCWGIFLHQDKQVVKALIISRGLYIIILILEVVLVLHHFNQQPWLAGANFVASVVAASLIDITFQRKFLGLLTRAIAIATIISIIVAMGLALGLL